MPKYIKSNPIVILCLFISIMLLPNLDSLQVTIMEARNFITAREMITDNNWLLTTMNGVPRYQKPPLPTWLTAFSGLVFGVKSVFGMRLPAILMVMVLAIFTFKLSKFILKSRAHSAINAFILITSFYVIGITIEAPWDVFTHGFMMVAIYYLFLLFKNETVNWQHVILASLGIAASLLSKGPVSFYALLLPFLIAFALTFKFNNITYKLPALITILVLALILGGSWYLYVRLEDPKTFEAITSKETANWTSYNVRPFYYYWSFFTQSGIWTIPAFIGLLYPYMKRRAIHYKAYKFTFLWTVIAVILLSIIPEKKSRYLMPVLIPLALNTGFYIEYLFRRFKYLDSKKETIPVYFNFILIAIIGLVAPFGLAYLFYEQFHNHIVSFSVFGFVLLVISILILTQLYKKKIKHVFLLTVVFFASIFTFGLPVFKTFTSENYKPISKLLQKNETDAIKTYSFGDATPETIWQYGEKIPTIHNLNTIETLPKDSKFGLLTYGLSKEDMDVLNSSFNIEKINRFDLNEAEPYSRQYKDRLTFDYYELSRK
ncbi:phospholipid carrier-dependent glycosyltransferase [Mesoflavibacter profundi]|uniref:Phospholipid carrier-dependent glycosyltransferase n=1 Tax=Mesoflavibacter profundi TaxID=2708110 RepID=A0ABT4RW96_9FLAO|nr:glycosyltransferase family 39 protein [Mesoflavibacter profundi]MDA0176097.1 phospholipid carrier-dependent glycosyltransferase [Mesoflavibacter profundi]